MVDDDDFRDGCELEFSDPDKDTPDDLIDALVMFADVWDDPTATEKRKAELIELGGADV